MDCNFCSDWTSLGATETALQRQNQLHSHRTRFAAKPASQRQNQLCSDKTASHFSIMAPGISFFREPRVKGLFPRHWFCIVFTQAWSGVLEWHIIEQSITRYPREQVSPTLSCMFSFNRWELGFKSALSKISAHWGRPIRKRFIAHIRPSRHWIPQCYISPFLALYPETVWRQSKASKTCYTIG